MSAAGPADRACRDACGDCAGSAPNHRRTGRHALPLRPVPSQEVEVNRSAQHHGRHDGGACACGPDCRLHLPSGAQAVRHRRNAHAKRDEQRCGIARHVCPCGAWTSCRPCALPPTPRLIAAWRRLRGLPRSFSIAPRKSLRYAAGAHSIFALPQEYQRPPNSPNSFLDRGFAAGFTSSARHRIFSKRVFAIRPLLVISAAQQPSHASAATAGE